MPRHKGVHRIHKFVVSDFKVYWDDPITVRTVISNLEGKRGCVIFYEDQENVTNDQWAFYYGAVIKECMALNEFAGYTKREVHDMLFEQLRSYDKKSRAFIEDFGSYGKKDMAKYIEELLPYLALEHGLHIKDPSQYKIDQFLTIKE